MVEKLKPCPFCGGEAIICGNNEHNNRTWVMCKACHACPGGDVPSLAVAVAAWNRRSTLSDAVAEREAEPPELRQWRDEQLDRVRDGSFLTSTPASELEALRKRVAELEKALEPFAATADETDEHDADSNHIWEHHTAMNISIGDLRTARRVREGGKVDG